MVSGLATGSSQRIIIRAKTALGVVIDWVDHNLRQIRHDRLSNCVCVDSAIIVVQGDFVHAGIDILAVAHVDAVVNDLKFQARQSHRINLIDQKAFN